MNSDPPKIEPASNAPTQRKGRIVALIRRRPRISIATLIVTLAGITTATFAVLRYFKDEAPSKVVMFAFHMPNGRDKIGSDLKFGIEQALDNVGGLPLQIKAAYCNDEGEAEVAAKCARDAVRDKNVLAVVGHLESSMMAATLNIYNEANMPVLMPVPTNTKLTDEKHKTILRMPPNDDSQAQTAADFMLSRKGIRRVAIIRDDDNPVYSHYLADKFKATLGEHRVGKLDAPVVVFDETIRKGKLGPIAPDRLRSLKVDAIFFAGTEGTVSTLLEMFVAAEYKPLILMTDGVIAKQLLKSLSEVPDHLFVTFQLNKTAPNGNYSLACSDELATFELSFCPYGFDSVLLIRQILAGTNRTAASTRTPLSRADIAAYFRYLRTGQELRGAFNNYTFDKKGETALRFAVWYARKDRKWVLYPWENDDGAVP